MSSSSRDIPGRVEFAHFLDIPTRWIDNDVYGHVNNVVYYSYFDTVVNRYLIDPGGLDFNSGEVFGVVAQSSCRYLKSFAYPDLVQAGLRVSRLGTTSVTYEIGLFHPDDPEPAAFGTFVHVFVHRVTRRPEPIPATIRAALERITIG